VFSDVAIKCSGRAPLLILRTSWIRFGAGVTVSHEDIRHTQRSSSRRARCTECGLPTNIRGLVFGPIERPAARRAESISEWNDFFRPRRETRSKAGQKRSA
jgi:hypothetical protein